MLQLTLLVALVWVGYQDTVLYGKGCSALEQAAQDSGGTPISGWGFKSCMDVALGDMSGGIYSIFSIPNNSMIIQSAENGYH